LTAAILKQMTGANDAMRRKRGITAMHHEVTDEKTEFVQIMNLIQRSGSTPRNRRINRCLREERPDIILPIEARSALRLAEGNQDWRFLRCVRSAQNNPAQRRNAIVQEAASSRFRYFHSLPRICDLEREGFAGRCLQRADAITGGSLSEFGNAQGKVIRNYFRI
jgi:hypothetical protein